MLGDFGEAVRSIAIEGQRDHTIFIGTGERGLGDAVHADEASFAAFIAPP
jgi:hypothetical protein